MDMAEVLVLRSLVRQRQTTAAEEVCGLFERTIAQHDHKVRRSQEDKTRHQKLLDAVFNCKVVLHRGGPSRLHFI